MHKPEFEDIEFSEILWYKRISEYQPQDQTLC